MDRRFQFSLRNVLLATTEAAVWCALYAVYGRVHISPSEPLSATLFYGALVGLPAAAVGAVLGHPGVGALCGLGSMPAITAMILSR